MPSPPAPRRCNRLVALTGLSLLCGCSSFESRWKQAAATVGTPAAPAAGIEGRWEGTWASDASSHSGGLRCVITRTAPGAYHADYHATYWKIFSFGYAMDLGARQEGDETQFDGAADLGWLAGGKYEYDGRATPTHFRCTYRSKSDHGHFEMKRPAGTVVVPAAPRTSASTPGTAPAIPPASTAPATAPTPLP